MAGFRTFATGEVLTAANVNDFLMKQSVMVFADAAARTAALGAEVTEGMLTYNLATDQLEVFDGSAFVLAAPVPPAGIGSNVVQTVKTDTFTTSSGTFIDVTGLTVTITPSSADSKVLILAQVAHGSSTGSNTAQGCQFRLAGGNAATFIGDAAGSRTRGIWMMGANGFIADYDLRSDVRLATVSFVDAPATASPVTYSIQARASAAGVTLSVNRANVESDAATSLRGASSITAIEVAA